MGDIAFNIFKDVDLNKTVDLDINKNVDVDVNINGQLATAEADAEAFGSPALAEVDAYTFVTEEGGSSVTERVPGLIDVLGNSVNFELGATIEAPLEGGGTANIAETLTVDFTGPSGVPGLPDVDDINGFGVLAPLTSPPPTTPDAPLPQPEFSFDSDLDLTWTGDPGISLTGGGVEFEYDLNGDLVINFGTRTLDLNGDGVAGTGILTLTVPEDTKFLVEYIGPTETPPETPPDGGLELEFETFVNDAGTTDPADGLLNVAYFTFDADPNNKEIFDGNPANQLPGEFFFDGIEVPAGTYLANSFELIAESLQQPALGDISDWALESTGIFYNQIDVPGDGQAFAYAESTAAIGGAIG